MRSLTLLTALCLVSLLMARPTVAQDTEPDTLDWRGYYPLEIGNTWETAVDGSFQQTVIRRRIESDTTISGVVWFVQSIHVEGVEFGEPIVGDDSLLIRYDEAFHRVLAKDMDAGAERDLTCDLSGDFGEEVQCDAGTSDPQPATFTGGYNESSETIMVGLDVALFAAWKHDPETVGAVEPVYYHGIGPLDQPGDGFDGTITFSYLKLGDVEYGSPAEFVGTEQDPAAPAIAASVYPNPAVNHLRIEVGADQLPVSASAFDLIGRRVVNTTCAAQSCALDVSELRSGIYSLVLWSRNGTRTVRSFVIAR